MCDRVTSTRQLYKIMLSNGSLASSYRPSTSRWSLAGFVVSKSERSMSSIMSTEPQNQVSVRCRGLTPSGVYHNLMFVFSLKYAVVSFCS